MPDSDPELVGLNPAYALLWDEAARRVDIHLADREETR